MQFLHTFDAFDAIFVIVPIFIAATFIFIVFAAVRGYVKDKKSPIVATKARVIGKHSESSTHRDANGHMHSSESYYLVFELSTGSDMRLLVRRGVYLEAREFEWGILTFQGTRFLRFESDSCTLER